eukprot:tig00020723_g13507.t1
MATADQRFRALARQPLDKRAQILAYVKRNGSLIKDLSLCGGKTDVADLLRACSKGSLERLSLAHVRSRGSADVATSPTDRNWFEGQGALNSWPPHVKGLRVVNLSNACVRMKALRSLLQANKDTLEVLLLAGTTPYAPAVLGKQTDAMKAKGKATREANAAKKAAEAGSSKGARKPKASDEEDEDELENVDENEDPDPEREEAEDPDEPPKKKAKGKAPAKGKAKAAGKGKGAGGGGGGRGLSAAPGDVLDSVTSAIRGLKLPRLRVLDVSGTVLRREVLVDFLALNPGLRTLYAHGDAVQVVQVPVEVDPFWGPDEDWEEGQEKTALSNRPWSKEDLEAMQASNPSLQIVSEGIAAVIKEIPEVLWDHNGLAADAFMEKVKGLLAAGGTAHTRDSFGMTLLAAAVWFACTKLSRAGDEEHEFAASLVQRLIREHGLDARVPVLRPGPWMAAADPAFEPFAPVHPGELFMEHPQLERRPYYGIGYTTPGTGCNVLHICAQLNASKELLEVHPLLRERAGELTSARDIVHGAVPIAEAVIGRLNLPAFRVLLGKPRPAKLNPLPPLTRRQT